MMPPLAITMVRPSTRRHVMRFHAARRELADLAIEGGRVAHADDTLRVLIVVLGGVEQLAVGRVDAMAEEMPVRFRMEPDRLAPVGRHGDAEAARPAGKRHPFARAWAKRDVMAAFRQLDGADIAAVEREQCR